MSWIKPKRFVAPLILYHCLHGVAAWGVEPANNSASPREAQVDAVTDPWRVKIDQLRAARQPFPTRIALHRGANEFAPENTWAAFRRALELRADYIEIDIHTTADGRHAVLHDRTVDRTTDGQGAVAKLTWDAISRLDAGRWFGEAFAGERVPLLETLIEQVLEWERARIAAGNGCTPVGFYLDAKAVRPEELAAVIAKYDLVERSVVYQGPGYLAKLHEIDPRIRAMPPLFKGANLDKIAEHCRPFAFDVAWEMLSRELIDDCHRRGIQVFSDALGDRERHEDYRQAIEWGIDVIQTDHPLRLYETIERLRTASDAASPR